MGDLLIRDVPDDLKEGLGKIAKATGKSLSDTARDMIRLAVDNHQASPASPDKNAYEQLREIFAPRNEKEIEESEQFAKIMDEIEVRRRTDFGRSFSFEE